MADLHFPRANKPQGFSVHSMAHHDGSADPVVRELLQNCLDAARKAGRATSSKPLSVAITIREWPVNELPGIESYRHAFRAAKKEEKRAGGATPSANAAMRRIEDVLSQERTKVLFCTDNGHGLNQDRMRAILSEARGDKGGASSSAGSFGVGHLAAFAASDLRFLLYGGRSKDGDCVGGHTFLASHRDQSMCVSRDGEGFWTADPDPDLHRCEFPTEIPALLDEEMDQIDQLTAADADFAGTGTVVCIIGFNNFREKNEEQAVDEILRVAATNFVAAIARGEMKLEIFAEPGDLVKRLDRATLRRRLEAHRHQKYSPRGSGGGWLPGAQALAAWQTIEHGSALRDTGTGVEVLIRPLGEQGGTRSRVNVFRNGMWITNNAPKLEPGSFSDYKPFDAVVLLAKSRLFDLVRASEGPAHRGIELKRLNERLKGEGAQAAAVAEQLAELKAELEQVAERLREEAGKQAVGDSFRPPGFAVFKGSELRKAERLPPTRHRPTNGDQESLVPGPDPNPGPAPRPDDPNPRRPKPGRALSMQAACRPLPNGDGKVDRVAVDLKVLDGRLTDRSELGFRLRQDSGSDASCDQPFPPAWLDLRSIEIVDGSPAAACEKSVIAPSNGNVKELSLPVGVARLIVQLGEPLADTRGLQVDLVHRKADRKEKAGPEERP